MKVFLNWSGEESRRIAGALRDWLPEVLDTVEPWMAADTFGRSNQWLEAQSGGFPEAAMIIACITKANAGSDWTSLDPTKMELSIADIPPQLILLLSPGVDHDDVSPRSTEYNILMLEREGTQILVERLNNLADLPIDNGILASRFDAMWPRLEANIDVQTRPVSAGIVARGTTTITNFYQQDTVRSSDIDELRGKLDSLMEAFLSFRNSAVPSVVESKEVMKANPAGRPRLFIGSSVEGKNIAEMIQLELHHELEITIWTQGAFPPMLTAMESLFEAARSFDFAAIVMTPDDLLIKRGVEHRAPRDNLLFEAGLFGGALGRARTFIVHPNDEPMEFPSDFKGVTLIDFTLQRSDNNLQAALGPACTQIKRAIGV